MNKNVETEILAGEMEILAKVVEAARAPEGDDEMILARMVKGISSENWEKASQEFSLKHWHAFPVSASSDPAMDEMASDSELVISPFREVNGALTGGMFFKALNRELLRLKRNGGCLSLIGAALADRRRLSIALGDGTVRRLEMLLGTSILHELEECDCLGILRKGQYICCLPGQGQLAARSFAERVQNSFEDAARPFFPVGGITAGQSATCALGIVNVPQGECGVCADLIRRAKSALEMALHKDGLIHQEISYSPLENTTLVQSSEKRFLFFGGDPT